MSSQLTVVVAGIVLVVAIVVALVIMRRGDSRFTYDTQHGTAPRATEGEGNTAATAFKGRFSILTAGVGAMFAALAVKLWGMQMVSSDSTTSRPRAIRPVRYHACRSWPHLGPQRRRAGAKPPLARRRRLSRPCRRQGTGASSCQRARHAVYRGAAQHPGQFRRRAEPAYDRD